MERQRKKKGGKRSAQDKKRHQTKEMKRKKIHCKDPKKLDEFITECPPSMISQQHYTWIQVTHPGSHTSSIDEVTMQLRWEEFLEVHVRSPGSVNFRTTIDEIACECDCLEGKWLIFCHPNQVDSVWAKVARGVMEGSLGISAKVSPTALDPSEQHVICVYTKNYQDEEDVMRVREGLRKLGIKQRLSYKADILTYLGIYQNNPFKIPVSFYSR